ncbi:hypothetical protein HGO38_30445 [Rhizobium sp. CG5]|uniref:hypothetical protein n=1 Tax=Rhizobium sp. CG5 TaxID=2726076 RepID=UPI002033DC35|nr:hypothetical protein [Rhizobium sp. CG5]MCM2477769.1 hypothetical protein [Rhizobium sp. CG5]
MSRKPTKQRNAEQVIRQQRVRKEMKKRRRPSRDDLARVLLWQIITAAQAHKDPDRALGKVRDSLTNDLERQGFAVRECEEVFHEIADRYSDGLYPFRPKRHLLPS